MKDRKDYFQEDWETPRGHITAEEDPPRRFPLEPETVIRLVVIGVLVIAAVAAAIAIPITLLNRARSNEEALRIELEEAQRILQLREDTVAALEKQQSGQKSMIENLQEQVDELLRIQDAQPVITSDQLSDQLGTLRELVTKEYIYTNAARREASKTWLWGWTLPFSDSSLLVTYDGSIKAGIDLNEVKFDVDEDARVITVTIPASKITDNVIPQETINVLEVKDGLFNRITFEDYNEFIGAEKPVMEQKAIERGLLDESDQEARAAIEAFLRLMPGIDSYELKFN